MNIIEPIVVFWGIIILGLTFGAGYLVGGWAEWNEAEKRKRGGGPQ